MEINEMTAEECSTFLAHASLGQLGCSFEDQPYVVPINFAVESGYLYAFSTVGQKVKWMRANPKVCVQMDEIRTRSEWVSIVVNGEYQELPEPHYKAERQHAISLLAKQHQWWLNALGERQMKAGERSIYPLFFRIRIKSISGLRASDKSS